LNQYIDEEERWTLVERVCVLGFGGSLLGAWRGTQDSKERLKEEFTKLPPANQEDALARRRNIYKRDLTRGMFKGIAQFASFAIGYSVVELGSSKIRGKYSMLDSAVAGVTTGGIIGAFGFGLSLRHGFISGAMLGLVGGSLVGLVRQANRPMKLKYLEEAKQRAKERKEKEKAKTHPEKKQDFISSVNHPSTAPKSTDTNASSQSKEVK